MHEDIGYYNSFIDFCNETNTNHGDDGTFETYRATLEPFMEWMTEQCGHMNEYSERGTRAADAQPNVAQPTGIANRTRSKAPATRFEIHPAKRGRNAITLEPTKQEAVRVKLSDGKEYTYGEIKHMMEWNKNMTPYRHPYTEEDKNKIKQLVEFATKGGKRKSRKNKKLRKTKKSRKIRRSRK